jgi:hypothetical protein
MPKKGDEVTAIAVWRTPGARKVDFEPETVHLERITTSWPKWWVWVQGLGGSIVSGGGGGILLDILFCLYFWGKYEKKIGEDTGAEDALNAVHAFIHSADILVALGKNSGDAKTRKGAKAKGSKKADA